MANQASIILTTNLSGMPSLGCLGNISMGNSTRLEPAKLPWKWFMSMEICTRWVWLMEFFSRRSFISSLLSCGGTLRDRFRMLFQKNYQSSWKVEPQSLLLGLFSILTMNSPFLTPTRSIMKRWEESLMVAELSSNTSEECTWSESWRRELVPCLEPGEKPPVMVKLFNWEHWIG